MKCCDLGPRMDTDKWLGSQREIGLGGHDLEMNELEIYEPLTEKVLGCAFEVINTLGCGFLEKV